MARRNYEGIEESISRIDNIALCPDEYRKQRRSSLKNNDDVNRLFSKNQVLSRDIATVAVFHIPALIFYAKSSKFSCVNRHLLQQRVVKLRVWSFNKVDKLDEYVSQRRTCIKYGRAWQLSSRQFANFLSREYFERSVSSMLSRPIFFLTTNTRIRYDNAATLGFVRLSKRIFRLIGTLVISIYCSKWPPPRSWRRFYEWNKNNQPCSLGRSENSWRDKELAILKAYPPSPR